MNAPPKKSLVDGENDNNDEDNIETNKQNVRNDLQVDIHNNNENIFTKTDEKLENSTIRDKRDYNKFLDHRVGNDEDDLDDDDISQNNIDQMIDEDNLESERKNLNIKKSISSNNVNISLNQKIKKSEKREKKIYIETNSTQMPLVELSYTYTPYTKNELQEVTGNIQLMPNSGEMFSFFLNVKFKKGIKLRPYSTYLPGENKQLYKYF